MTERSKYEQQALYAKLKKKYIKFINVKKKMETILSKLGIFGWSESNENLLFVGLGGAFWNYFSLSMGRIKNLTKIILKLQIWKR